ncbi:hypothetical protein ACLKA6_015357 [Drosophila palustris]
MGVSKKTQDKSGFEYAMAVMRMCDILHARHRSIFLRNEFIFTLTRYYKEQGRLLNIIHGLTTKVIRSKKAAFEKGARGSLAQSELKAAALVQEERELREQQEQQVQQSKIGVGVKSDQSGTTVAGLSYGQSAGLKDDLDVEDNDIGEKKRLAFLDLMLESAQNGALITDTEIKEQVDTIMFEGHDTTAAGSSFFLSLMGIHQDVQDRVIAELDGIFGDSQRPATFQDTLEMKYLERCLMETLRMFPPVPLIARELQEDLKLNSGPYVIPRGATVTVATILLHRNPKVYDNPNVFDPDNFLPERQANRHYYAFVPFSAGPRSCVGRKYAMLKLKILLSTIMRNYRVYSDLSESDFRLQADIILKREEGFRVRLQPRQPGQATTTAGSTAAS